MSADGLSLAEWRSLDHDVGDSGCTDVSMPASSTKHRSCPARGAKALALVALLAAAAAALAALPARSPPLAAAGRAGSLREGGAPGRRHLVGSAGAEERSRDCKEYGGKMIILVTTSHEFNDMFRNWFYSARPFLDWSTQQVVVLAHDKESVASLTQLAANLSAPSFDVIDAHALGLRENIDERRLADFKTKEYGDLVTQRPLQMMHFLNLGCDVLYSDIDMVWLKDPLVRIEGGEPHGLYLATDEEDGSLRSFCTCFIYARPTNTTNMLMSEWARRSRGQVQNQPFFNQALRAHGGTFEEAIRRMDIGVLPVWDHPPGCLADNFSNASVLHANWIEGHAKKVEFFKNRSIWHPDRIGD